TSDPCKVTLTCRGHDLSLNMSCSNDTCWQEGGAPSGSALTLFVTEGTIICNHSNEVNNNVQHCVLYHTMMLLMNVCVCVCVYVCVCGWVCVCVCVCVRE